MIYIKASANICDIVKTNIQHTTFQEKLYQLWMEAKNSMQQCKKLSSELTSRYLSAKANDVCHNSIKKPELIDRWL